MINTVAVVDKLHYDTLKNELVLYRLCTPVIINTNVLINKFSVIFWHDKNLFCTNEFWLAGVWFHRNVPATGRREIPASDSEVHPGAQWSNRSVAWNGK